ncbi:MAG TPA: HD domain-containing phosphohydrolase [Anaerolineales bacterium]|nr:HD domain-containing phosphohydrolase [Anaerolineales bacterium]
MVIQKSILRYAVIAGVAIWILAAGFGVLANSSQVSDAREMFAYSFIVPILVAAFFFGQVGGLLVALIASLVSGSLIITDVNLVQTPFVQRLMFQIVFFNSVALVTSFLSDRAKSVQRELRRQVERLTALRQVDLAITTNLDLKSTLDIILDRLVWMVDVDAADILLADPETQRLTYEAMCGLDSMALAQFPLDQNVADQSVQERRIIHVGDLDQLPGGEKAAASPFASYYAVPLVAKGQVKGVLEVYQKENLELSSGWMEFLETLAGQAAIAINNAQLIGSLQRSNADLVQAYDETLLGWSHALDLRDRETEGHTHRVTELAVQLAQVMGLLEAQIVHLERGALLHDIGKMGISDSILLKPGPLTDDEWVVMRKHPTYAHELLQPIAYLHPALPIPHFHHEHWDGSGYPLGLKGEQIPLEARIFSVVDVWDALLSDRPYRKAWTKEQAVAYITEQAGELFDPQVVETFIKLVQNNLGEAFNSSTDSQELSSK